MGYVTLTHRAGSSYTPHKDGAGLWPRGYDPRLFLQMPSGVEALGETSYPPPPPVACRALVACQLTCEPYFSGRRKLPFLSPRFSPGGS